MYSESASERSGSPQVEHDDEEVVYLMWTDLWRPSGGTS